MTLDQCIVGDCRDVMRGLVREGTRAQCIVTSPPYFGLRDYGVDGQLGLEPTPTEYITTMVEVFAAAREMLADDGTLWLNIGDSYAGSWGAQGKRETPEQISRSSMCNHPKRASHTGTIKDPGLKPKDLIGIPWLLAFALRADGWYLRQEIIWSKSNAMPESVTDRCTKSHEHLFLLCKSPSYYCNMDAIKEQAVGANEHDLTGRTKQRGMANTFKRADSKRAQAIPGQSVGTHRDDREESDWPLGTRNKRSVWTIPTRPYAGVHFAVMPEELVEPCILAGSRPGGIVFDPFMGSGTVASVAQRLGRRWLGAELNPDYLPLQAERTRQAGLQLESA